MNDLKQQIIDYMKLSTVLYMNRGSYSDVITENSNEVIADMIINKVIDTIEDKNQKKAQMWDRFRHLVLDEGRVPEYHRATINELREKWPKMYDLISTVQEER